MDVAAQIADLTRRVAALEVEAQGQQRYNARILGMLTELRDDVAILRSHAVGLGQRFDALEARVGGLEAKVGGLEAKVDRLEAKVGSLDAKVSAEIGGLRRDLPGIIAETMREVLREGK
jgi:outer membrane murein-binding lipoprotein Lpp